MTWRAEDIMTQNVVCVYEDMSLRDLTELFLRRHITAAPVTSREGELRGVVAQTDLLRHTMRLDEELVDDSDFYRAVRIEGRRLPKTFRLDPGRATVAEVMNPTVHSVGEKVSVENVARLMRDERLHRVIVERRGKVVGLISTFDLIAVLSTSPRARPSAAKKAKK